MNKNDAFEASFRRNVKEKITESINIVINVKAIN